MMSLSFRLISGLVFCVALEPLQASYAQVANGGSTASDTNRVNRTPASKPGAKSAWIPLRRAVASERNPLPHWFSDLTF